MVKKSEDWLLKCPTCDKKLWFSNIGQHRRLKHLEIPMPEFEAKIISKITNGKLVPSVYRLINSEGAHYELVGHVHVQLTGTPAHVLRLLNIKPAHDREYTDER